MSNTPPENIIEGLGHWQNSSPADEEKLKKKKFPVVELFGPTIEGEGAVIGKPTMFIRFGLCDYKCTKCDSMHAVDPAWVKKLAVWQTAEEIAAALTKAAPEHLRTVTFSGGNPAIHDLTDLVNILNKDGWEIVVETQGTKAPDWLLDVDHVVVSPKSPGMGEHLNPSVFLNFARDILIHSAGYSVKIVVFTAQDLEFVVGIMGLLEQSGLGDWQGRLYLSLGNPFPPVFTTAEDGSLINESPPNNELVNTLLMDYNRMCGEILKDPRLKGVRFLPQLHVLVWGNETEK